MVLTRRRAAAAAPPRQPDAENCDPQTDAGPAWPESEKRRIQREEFDIEVEKRCHNIMVQAEAMTVSIKNTLNVELMRLPKKIRTMPLGEFCGKYQGDLQIYDTEQFKQIVDTIGRNTPRRPKTQQRPALGTIFQSPEKPATTRKYPKRKAAGKTANPTPSPEELASPEPDRRQSKRQAAMAPPSTGRQTRSMSRYSTQSRESEVFATPVGKVGTRSVLETPGTKFGSVRSAKATIGRKRGRDELCFTIETEDGEELDIGDKSVQRALEGEDREAVLKQLELMKTKVSSMMRSIKSVRV